MTSSPYGSGMTRASDSMPLQEMIELHAIELARTAPVQEAARAGERALRCAVADVDAPSLARLSRTVEEITLNALMAFGDGRTGQDLPRMIMKPPRRIGDESVPGNRGLHDNPDTVYRLVPLDGQSDFVLHGRVGASPATIFELSVLTSSWETIGHLTRADLAIEPGSRFRVHIGREPGAEADHFVRTSADAEMLLLRETLADWATEQPCRLSVESRREGGGPRDRDDEAYLAEAVARVEKWFAESVRLTEGPLSRPANAFAQPVITNEHGKLVTMAYSIGHFHVSPGRGPGLRRSIRARRPMVTLPITNLWGTTGDRLARCASWNSSQAIADEDGRITCVLALTDPGVHNWLEPEGLERGFLFLRWAGLPADRAPERPPAVTSRLVRSEDLRAVLPRETRWVDAEERESIFAQRASDYQRRFDGPWNEIRRE